MYTHNILLKI